MLVKLVIEADVDTTHRIAAISDLKFSCGGLVKVEERTLTHYTEHGDQAKTEWNRREGFNVVAENIVATGAYGIRRLLADLEETE